MNPLQNLRRILSTDGPDVTTGAVVTAAGETLLVQTPRGIVEAKNVGAQRYRAGDEVLIRGGLIQMRVKSADALAVYRL